MCARRALEIDSRAPEVHNLLGYAAALGGDIEEALEHYRDAIALDETYLEAMLNAAEVLVSPRGEWDEAIELCDDALDYAETTEEIADCILLKVDALLGKGDTEEAVKALTRIQPGPYENPNYDYLIARAYYEVGQVEKAAPLIEAAVERAPNHADAHYYLGIVRDERGDRKGATRAFLAARALDLRDSPPPWSPSPEAFAAIVRQVLGDQTTSFHKYLYEAEVYCLDVVGAELVTDGVDPRAQVIVDAGPVPEPGAPPSQQARAFIYQRSIERNAGSIDTLAGEVARAIEHEVASLLADRQKLDESPLN
jgi:tetratricopeptide (TPR) repeat protein